MSRVFADTHFYVAILDKEDKWHDRAVALAENAYEITTTEYVQIEVGNSLQRSQARVQFPTFARALYDEEESTIVPGSERLMRAAIELFEQYEDKRWSLTDCASFVVMRDLEIADALTADRHLAQAGFNVLLG